MKRFLINSWLLGRYDIGINYCGEEEEIELPPANQIIGDTKNNEISLKSAGSFSTGIPFVCSIHNAHLVGNYAVPLTHDRRVVTEHLYGTRETMLGRNAKEVWKSNSSESSKNKQVLKMLLELYLKRKEDGHLTFEALSARWDSFDLFWKNGWTIPQCIKSKSKRIMAGVQTRSL